MSNVLIENLQTIKDARDDIKTAIENKGAVGVTDDITTYANLIDNISGDGSGDVKLFETIEEMQNDPDAHEGDLAVVYREEIQPITEESEFDSCTFPNTVVLKEAFTGNIYGRFRAVDHSVMFDGMVEMSSSRFRFNGWSDGDSINVQYTSSDGITYTRTDGGEELQEFGTTIKWEDYGDPFNDVIGNFMKIGGKHFDGLYEYGTGMDIDISCLGIKFSDLYPTYNQNILYQYHSNLVDLARLNEDDIYVWTSMVFKIQAESNLYYGQTLYKPIEGYSPLNNTNVSIGQMIENNTNYLIAYMISSPADKTLLHYTGSGFENVNILTNEWQSFTVSSSTYYYKILATIDPTEWVANYRYSLFSMGNSGTDRPSTFVKTGSTATGSPGGSYAVTPTYGASTKYFYAQTQLTIKNPDDLLPGLTGYGNKGIVTGDSTVMNNLPHDEVWDKVFNISTSINNIPNSSSDKWYTTNHLSQNEGFNKLYGYVIDENGQYQVSRFEYANSTNRLGYPKVHLNNKLYFILQNTAEGIIILEFDITTETTTTYNVANSASGSVLLSVTENYIVYGYTTGSYRAYTYHVRKQHKTTGEQTEAASWAIYNNNNIYLVGGINDKVLVGTDRNQNSYATYMRTVNLATNAVTIVGNTGIPMGLPGMHFIDNRYAYIPTVYKVTGSSLIKDSGYGWFYDFENNVGLWVYPTVKHTSGWYSYGVCPATADYAILGMADDHPEIFIKYSTATHTLSEMTVSTTPSSSYKFPICIKGDNCYFSNCIINVRTGQSSEIFQMYGDTYYCYDISVESTRIVMYHPFKTNKSVTYKYRVSPTRINLYELPDMILIKGSYGEIRATILDCMENNHFLNNS